MAENEAPELKPWEQARLLRETMRPCPFCGDAESLEAGPKTDGDGGVYVDSVLAGCKVCNVWVEAQGEPGNALDLLAKAVAKWNTRADLTAPDAPCILGEPLMHGPQPYRWCVTHNRLLLSCESAAPDAASLKDAIKAIAAPKAESIAKGIRELGLASFGTEGASKAQFFIETQLLDFLQAVDCLRLLHTDTSPDAVRQAQREAYDRGLSDGHMKRIEDVNKLLDEASVPKDDGLGEWSAARRVRELLTITAALRAEGEKGER